MNKKALLQMKEHLSDEQQLSKSTALEKNIHVHL